MGNAGVDLREDVREAIERAWPDGMVEPFDSDESYFWEVNEDLAAALRGLPDAWLTFEREAKGKLIWLGNSDPDEDPADIDEPSRSFHLFLVCPKGKEFSFEAEIESYGEPEEDVDPDDLPLEIVAGRGTTGWSVAVSLLAPLAVITLSDQVNYENGDTSGPSIESTAFTETGERVDEEAEFRKSNGEQAFEKLLKLRERITEILEAFGIAVLPEEEWRKLVPGLQVDPEVLVGEPLRVLDAFFFECM